MDPELVLFYTGLAGAQDTIALMEVGRRRLWLAPSTYVVPRTTDRRYYMYL